MAPIAERDIHSIPDQFDPTDRHEDESDDDLHDQVTGRNRQMTSPAPATQKDPAEHRRVVDHVQRRIAEWAMRASCDNGLFLRGPTSDNVDERTDTRTQIEKPEHEPILTRPLHAFDRERDLRIVARKLPT